jgi:hypothetical protein
MDPIVFFGFIAVAYVINRKWLKFRLYKQGDEDQLQSKENTIVRLENEIGRLKETIKSFDGTRRQTKVEKEESFSPMELLNGSKVGFLLFYLHTSKPFKGLISQIEDELKARKLNGRDSFDYVFFRILEVLETPEGQAVKKEFEESRTK